MLFEKIHSDIRGEIYIFKESIQYPEITLLKTIKGFARGGCIHNINCEYFCVLEGKVKYVYENKNKIIKKYMKVGEVLVIPKSTPHYFISITDSLVIEWGVTEEERKVKHPKFREIVENINNKMKVNNDN